MSRPRGLPTSGPCSVTLCGRMGILSWPTVGHVLCLADVSVVKMSLSVVTELEKVLSSCFFFLFCDSHITVFFSERLLLAT